jgi:hypothetical protein
MGALIKELKNRSLQYCGKYMVKKSEKLQRIVTFCNSYSIYLLE